MLAYPSYTTVFQVKIQHCFITTHTTRLKGFISKTIHHVRPRKATNSPRRRARIRIRIRLGRWTTTASRPSSTQARPTHNATRASNPSTATTTSTTSTTIPTSRTTAATSCPHGATHDRQHGRTHWRNPRIAHQRQTSTCRAARKQSEDQDRAGSGSRGRFICPGEGRCYDRADVIACNVYKT